MEPITIVKIGGNIIDDDAQQQQFLRDFVQIPGKKILVHGGGKIASRIGETMGITPNVINGRRITDAATLDLVTMVYGGLINRKMVAALQHHGCNALGLTGADVHAMVAARRPVGEIDFGWVGDPLPAGVNVNGLKALLKADFCPVFAPLTYDGEGNLLNTNADTIASVLALALSSVYRVTLLYCFEQQGVLDEREKVVPFINEEVYQKLLKSGALSGGILPKLENALAAIRGGVHHIWIGNGEALGNFPHPSPPFSGTLISQKPVVHYTSAP